MADQPEVLGLSQAVLAPAAPRLSPLSNRDFRLLWLGESVSLFGDQFYLIALPLLVFQMTGSSLAFGTILMVAGIPRAALMLVGGVMTDRFSPRGVMIVSNLLRLVITVLLALVVAGQAVQLWMLYVIAFCFGLVDAFFHPAYRAMVPTIVDQDSLQASNSLMLGASQLIQTAGPGIAGMLMNLIGAALAFTLDALTFLFTAIMLLLMRTPTLPKQQPEATAASAAIAATAATVAEDAPKRAGILPEIGAMLAFVRRDSLVSTVLMVIAAINLLFGGPLVVGSATLSRVRFPEGSAALGAMLSAFAIGMLAGTLAAGTLRTRWAGPVSLCGVAIEGILMIGIAFAPALVVACVLWALIGFGAGFGNVTVVTLTQKHVTREMMGRFMSLVVLAELGLAPISNALAGALADLNVTMLFVLAGGLMTLTALAALANPRLRVPEPA